MFEKLAKHFNTARMPVEALNKPEWAEFNLTMFKVASIDKTDPDAYLAGFDLEAAIKTHPEHLFVKIFAIKKDEVNDNGDAFSEDELRKAAHTFVGVPVFTNHQNDDIEKAKGIVVHAWFDNKKGGIWIISRIDKAAYPRIARGIEEGYITGCFPGDAPVLMADGTEKLIKDIDLGDYVISGNGLSRQVIGKRQRHYDYPLRSLRVEGIKQPLVCTDYHQVAVYRAPANCACGCGEVLVSQKDSRRTSQNFLRIFKQGHNPRGIKIEPQYIQKVKAIDLEVGDLLIEPVVAGATSISDDEAFLVGLFLAEGSYEKRDGVRHSVIFNFGHHELETLAFQCQEKLISAFGEHRNAPTVNFYPEASQSRVSLYGKDVADWFFDRCGEYSDGKALSAAMMSLGIGATASLLAGYIEGDGYNVKGETYGVATVSAKLASQLRVLFGRIGVRSNYRVRKASGFGYKPVHELTFGLTTSGELRNKLIYKKAAVAGYKPAKWHSVDGYILRPIKEVESVDFNGTVYDLEVEEDHTYCVNHIAVSNSSMGAQVQYSLCSTCHNRAAVANEYCSHIKNQKNKKISSRVKCAYHTSECKPDDDCPICGCKKGESKYHELKQAQVHEWNYGIKFIEDSLVVNPACHDCQIDCILNVPVVETKLSQLRDRLKAAATKVEAYQLLKAANDASGTTHTGVESGTISTNDEGEMTVEEFVNSMPKTAGKIELEKLNEAVGLLEVVSRSMLDQKQQVSLDYVSDIIDVMAKAQETIDELDEQGYGGLPSSANIQEYLANVQGGGTGANTQAAQPHQQAPQTPPMAAPQGDVSDLGGLATVTKPTFKGSSNGKKEEIRTADLNIKNRIESLRKKLAEALEEHQATNKAGGAEQTNKESQVMENDTTKIAAGSGQTDYAQQVTTEKVLADKTNSLHPRTEKSPEEITQSQLGGTAKTDVTSDSPQVRFDDPANVITEAQMEAVKGDDIVRHSSFPEVITEKQWEAIHREAFAVLSEEQGNHITQAQLRDLLKDHTWADDHNPDVITNRQLEEGGFGEKGTAGNLDRLNSDGVEKAATTKYDATKLVEASIEAMADTIVGYNKSPEEVVKAASFINRNPQAVIKASYLMLVNALPSKKAARVISRGRSAYFAKIASDNQNFVKPVDALVACMADHCSGLRAEDFIEALAFATSQKVVMAQVHEKVQQKISACDNVDETPTFDKFDLLRKAAESLDRSEDGLYQVQAPLSQIGVSHEDKKAFAQAAIKIAMASDELPKGVVLTPVEVRVRTKPAVTASAEEIAKFVPHVAVTISELTKLTSVQLEALRTKRLAAKPSTEKRAAAREEIVTKTAQMGGGMPDQMGAAPGAGAGGMPGMGAPGAGAPGGQQPGVESFDQTGDQNDAASDTTDLEPKPPGSVCPVCTSEDVDIVEGKGKCKSCGAEFTYKVNIDVTKWPNTLDKGESASGEPGATGEKGTEGAEGEGFAMPEQGGADPSIPVAAMTRMNGSIIEKLSAIKDRVVKAAGNIEEMQKLTYKVCDGGLGISLHNQQSIVAGNYMLGEISPLTGSLNTTKLADGAHICLDTGTPYIMETAVSKDDPSRPWIQWKWFPKIAGNECSSCNRVKKAFVAALVKSGRTEAEFESMDLKARGEIILQMKASGAFGVVKTASKNVTALNEFKAIYAMPKVKFPMSNCREKLARRFGENAVSMSGPCEGQNLADCVCKSLKKAEVYAEMLAVKIASVWALPDASDSCVQDFILDGFSIKQAKTCCEAMKTKYAQSHEHFADELGSQGDFGGHDDLDGGEDASFPPSGEDDADPFGEDAGTPPEDKDPFAGDETEVPVDADPAAAGDPAVDPAAGAAPELAPTSVTGPASATGAPAVTPAPSGGGIHINQNVLQALETLKDALTGQEAAAPVPAAGADLSQGQAREVEEAIDPVLSDLPEEGTGDEVGGEVGEEPEKSESTVTEAPSDDMGFGEDEDKSEPAAEDTSFKSDDAEKSEGEDLGKENETFASSMKPSTIGRTGKIYMNLDKVVAAVQNARLKKTAEEGKKLDVEQAQDAVPFKYDGGKPMGNEAKFTAEKVKVESNASQSTMGHEKPVKAEMPSVPTGDQRMGHEDASLKPELANKVTGHGGSEGIAASGSAYKGSTRDIAYTLAARIKAASEKKVDKHVPTSETEGIGKIQDGKVHPNAAAEKPFSANEPEIPEKNKGAFIGHEEESIHNIPKATSEFAPSVPTDGEADKVDEIKGTTITTASSNSDVKSQQYKEAFRIAGRMVADGIITSDNLMQTISELREYSPKMQKAYETKLFAVSAKPKIAARKGLIGQDGTEQPVVINQTDAKKANLSQRIAGLFTLSKQMDTAEDSDADVRRKYRR